MTDSFWDSIRSLAGAREADVETWLILPLLEALGHDRSCISAKLPVLFQEGGKKRRGRNPEADLVVYAEQPFGRATSLIVVEAKRPSEKLDPGREQGESYAQNLRAPLLLLTNGVRFEVWQLQVSSESELVLACDVADLAARRGEVEGLLGREAVKAHCAALQFKRFNLLARDLSAYEVAEHTRLGAVAGAAIPRTLRGAASQPLTSTRLLDHSPKGAVVNGMSGYGKTTLAASLLLEGFERRWEGKLEALPIDVFLPDFAASGQTVEMFLTRRVAAHKPGFTEAMLATIAREHGLLIAADGFERVAENQRSHVEAALRTLLKDFPKTLVYLMSRELASPTGLDLPVLRLTGYSREELADLAKRAAATRPNLSRVFEAAPDYMFRVAEVPLFAELVLDHYALTGHYITDVASLYEHWLARMLNASGPVDRALDRSLLQSIAAETVAGPIGIDRALELGGAKVDTRSTLNRLATADAISLRGATVELGHEGLADYLRALRFWRGPADSSGASLAKLTFDPSSQFATLLVATAPSADDRGEAWQAIAATNLQLAIRTLHLLVGEVSIGDSTPRKPALRLLEDIRLSVDTLASSHLGPVRDLVLEEIAGVSIRNLGIRGSVGKDDVGFSFFDVAEGPKVELTSEWYAAAKAYGNRLRESGYGREAGRVLGLKRVQQALQELMTRRRLRGGVVWSEERVFGRLRHLNREYGSPARPGPLADARRLLQPHANTIVSRGVLSGQPTFPMNELLDDIDWLTGRGVAQVTPWWDDHSDFDVRTPDGQARLAAALDAYYRRLQLAYAEVVDTSFPALAPYLQTLRMMPLRLQIQAIHRSTLTGGVATSYLRWPVRTYDEAGADVTFPHELMSLNSMDEIDAYYDKTVALLAQFGRAHPDPLVTWGMSGLPDFLGHETAHDRFSDESAVVRGAMSWLHSDLKALFSEMPPDAPKAGPTYGRAGDLYAQ
ncbi:type I restriction enzyme HsdR N-terminal domain-containing protein [Mesorhizobium sp. YC-39]|uniref:type I restriction enzyme HsdR N-terminal domain-containing protein n=1 Tax=unclassified Mesorhizobium TaxID=325217 RepID=UPI0021E82EC7|nr:MULTISPECIES: type I restriction enzyme HsdR N-terminal domain-containing protein [unclassified Mesorhizobium]MCV3211551.1 type I restriction enzyme HsdR N-terminal domain-containing protein [Mesorhizobium sp. YC-2]MCV3233251.1 type I restriction enzyme HsdR N-terminal domain-containing protein [Mesorhizobium sp. YC-39]